MVTTPKIASPLSRKATLVAINVSHWGAHKLDRKVTDETNRQHHASTDAGRYNKLLIEKRRLKAIIELVSQARSLHYTYTKPWCDDGLRILPNALHAEFAKKFRELKRAFDDAVDAFVRDYPHYINERKRALGNMFNENDYPSPLAIKDKFKLEIRTMSVPEADDFRSDVLDADTVADIKRELEATNKQVVAAAMQDSVTKVAQLVSHMSTKLKTFGTDETGKRNFFTDSLVGNIRELADLLPAFNLTNDPKFDAITERIKAELCVEDADTLRDNEKVRESVQKSADDILKDVSSLLG